MNAAAKKLDRRAALMAGVKAEETALERSAQSEAEKRAERLQRAEGFIKSGGSLLAGAPVDDAAGEGASTSLPHPPLASRPGAAAVAGPAASGGEHIRVPLNLVDDNKYNARKVYRQETVVERANSIAADGQKVACAAVRSLTSPGRYMLLDGGYRKRALTHLNAQEIDLRIEVVTSELDLYRLSRLYNEQREQSTAVDDALCWRELLDAKLVADYDGIAAMIGKKKAAVSKTMALLKLPAAALERVRETPAAFGSAVGYELAGLSELMTEEALLALMERVAAGEVASRELESMRQRLMDNRPVRKSKEVSRQYPIVLGGEKSGTLKEWDSGRVMLDVKFATADEREQFVAAVRRQLVSSGG